MTPIQASAGNQSDLSQDSTSTSSQSDNPYADLMQGDSDDRLVYNITKGGKPDDSDNK